MDDYEKTRDIIEKEIQMIKKHLDERPKIFSEYGRGYWKGNVDGLDWVLGKLAEIHLPTQNTNENSVYRDKQKNQQSAPSAKRDKK